ncbi:MAG: hypothetical protein OHK0039_14300 [Bacteroidia bacterium]
MLNMISVEKRRLNRHHPGKYRPTVGFIVYPHTDSEAGEEDVLRVELGSFQPEGSVIRLTDEWGQLLLRETYEGDDQSGRLVFTVRNLRAGKYFFEVDDGFYYQVKEIYIPD